MADNRLINVVENALEDRIDYKKALRLAMNLPMVKVDRAEFLEKELRNYYSSTYIKRAIENNPAYAGISRQKINQIAKQVINYETNKVSAISAIAAAPGGIAMFGTIPADVVQFFGFVLRVMQKLVYLYGFPQIELDENKIDDETMNLIFVFLGVMFGADSANAAVKLVADKAAKQIARKLPRKQLMKGTVYPMIKTLLRELGFNINKQIFADTISKTGVPIVSSIISGSITYGSFKISANRLKKHLQTLNLSDPEFYKHGGIL